MITITWTRLRKWAATLSTARQLGVLAAAAWLALSGAPALAQSDKGLIRMLVGFPAGGTIDTVARLLAEHLKDELGATVIVDSKPGAGGQIAAQALKATPTAEIQRVNAALRKVLARPDVRERMAKIVFEPAAGSPEDLARLVRAGTALWEPVVRSSGWVPQ